MASKVEIISNSMVLLGGNTIASLDEDSTESRIGASLYETSYLFMMTIHRWRFNTKQAQLARLTAEPLYGYLYQFQLPTDLLYLIKIDSHTRYQIYGTTLHSNQEEIKIDYQYRVEEGNLPAYFTKPFEFFLASQFAIPLTGDEKKTALYESKYTKHMKSAKFVDSTQSPSDSFIDSPYVSVRQ